MTRNPEQFTTPSACATSATSPALVTELRGPINANTGEELDLATLRELGVARVSYGPRFYFVAMADLKCARRRCAGPGPARGEHHELQQAAH